MKKLKILLLSARPLDHSANLAKDYMDALLNAGHSVDFHCPVAVNAIDRKTSLQFLGEKMKILSISHRLGFFLDKEREEPFERYGYFMVNGIENKPAIHPHSIEIAEDQEYDLIITLFWYNVFSSYTLRLLYERYKCLIVLISVDMAPMTGGCFYFGNCKNYQRECKNCPAVSGLIYNFAHHNFLNKKKNYSSIKMVYVCNTYMKSFAERTGLFKNIVTQSTLINPQTFHPIDRSECIRELNLPQEKTFIVSVRYSATEYRKGYEYAVSAMNYFYSQLSDGERKAVLILLLGGNVDSVYSSFDFDVHCFGHLDVSSLVKVYNASSVFLCPSIDDAGPSMVNQAMMCGTPVVSFDSGTAKDVVVDGFSGFKVPLFDSKALGEGVHAIYKMDNSEYIELRKNTLTVAYQWNHPTVFVKSIESIYKKYRG